MAKMVCRTPERSLILFPVFNAGTPTVKAFENIDLTPMRDSIYFYSPLVHSVGDVRPYLNDDYSFILIEAQRGWRYYLHLLRTQKLLHLCQRRMRKAVYVDLDILDAGARDMAIVLPVQKTPGLTIAQITDHKHILDFFFQLLSRDGVTVYYRSQKPRANIQNRIEELTRYHLSMVATEIKWNGKGSTTHFELKEKSLIVWFEPSMSLRAARHLQRQFYPHPLVVIPLIPKIHQSA